MATNPELQAVFGMPPKEAVTYLADKFHIPSEGWETVAAETQQRAFTVAQTAGFNVLGDIYDALKRALDEGWTVKQFQDHLEPLLRTKGWWGQAVDPATGEILKTYPGTNRPVRYGSSARLKLIYDTNMTVSYGAGRRYRQQATRGLFPYWRYLATLDNRTRPAHRALHNRIWPADATIWDHIYPPNGFRCRCTVQAVNRETAMAEGVQATGEIIERNVPVNAAGDQVKVKGWRSNGQTFFPDPGWDVAPGKRDNLKAQLEQAKSRLP